VVPLVYMDMNQHPHTEVVDVVCATCGTAHRVRSTAATFSVDVCSNCHPAYTGIARTVNTGSRVERFNRRLARAAA
jgi:large subunit ribosomal protein L31